MSEIEPALTSEEWQKLGDKPWNGSQDDFGSCINYNDCDGAFVYRPHAVAAMCLHAQPFGFTRYDVELIKFQAGCCVCADDVLDMMALAVKIAALLPPE